MPQWEVTGKRSRALGQMPDSLTALPLCYLHFLDKTHHFWFFPLKQLLYTSHDLCHGPSANHWATNRKKTARYRSFEEFNQRGLRTETMKQFVFCFTHVLFHTGREHLRLMWPKLIFLVGEKVLWVEWWPTHKTCPKTCGNDLIWEKGLCRYNWVQDLEMR